MNNKNASFVVGDASYTWDWNVVTSDVWRHDLGIPPHVAIDQIPSGAQWRPMYETSNDFSWTKPDIAYLNEAVYRLPGWFSRNKKNHRMTARKAFLPVQKAFRTAGLVRGAHPFALIVDDYQVDQHSHKYDWIAQLPADMKLWKTADEHASTEHPKTPFKRDIYLFKAKSKDQSSPDPGQAVLLVRVLDISTKPGERFDTLAEVRNVALGKKHNQHERRLYITSNSVSPNFKVMLYPYCRGKDPLPTTQWRDNHLTIGWPDGSPSESIGFPRATSGKVNVIIDRGGKTIAALDRKVSPTPNRAPTENTTRSKAPQPLKAWDFSNTQGMTLVKGHYDRRPPSVANGVAEFSGHGNQQITFVPVKLPSANTFTILLRFKTRGHGPCDILHGNGWGLSLGHWQSVVLKVPGSTSSKRHKKQVVGDTFVAHWADAAIVKDGQLWTLYVNGKIFNVAPAEKPLDHTVLRLVSGNAKGNPAYGMTGAIKDIKVFSQALSVPQIKDAFASH